jgi:hypothetical protein
VTDLEQLKREAEALGRERERIEHRGARLNVAAARLSNGKQHRRAQRGLRRLARDLEDWERRQGELLARGDELGPDEAA